MYIEFKDKVLKKCFESKKERDRKLGTCAKRFVQRINLLIQIDTMDELFREHSNLNPHRLHTGVISIRLTENERLLFWDYEKSDGRKYLLIDEVKDTHGNKL